MCCMGHLPSYMYCQPFLPVPPTCPPVPPATVRAAGCREDAGDSPRGAVGVPGTLLPLYPSPPPPPPPTKLPPGFRGEGLGAPGGGLRHTHHMHTGISK